MTILKHLSVVGGGWEEKLLYHGDYNLSVILQSYATSERTSSEFLKS